jgi:nitrite reductase/ring-hydroxylating ferredoxin subunit
MTTRAQYLSTRYGGYFHREVPEEDVELSHVGPDTPCGEYLRRFWQPICLSDELKDLPHRVKILGDELVVFRDRSGTVGLLELHCPHRGASLEYGLIDACGIRCCYHGWLFAADGTILELQSLSQTFGSDRLVEEMVVRFTHTIENWLLPTMRPTGRRAEFIIAGVIGFENGKVAHEHIYWDQATLLSQMGVLDHPLAAAGTGTVRLLSRVR